MTALRRHSCQVVRSPASPPSRYLVLSDARYSLLLLDAAFLVPAKQATAFRSAVTRNTKGLSRSGIAVSLTGPWPPYNFI